jgi:hypothetical protein
LKRFVLLSIAVVAMAFSGVLGSLPAAASARSAASASSSPVVARAHRINPVGALVTSPGTYKILDSRGNVDTLVVTDTPMGRTTTHNAAASYTCHELSYRLTDISGFTQLLIADMGWNGSTATVCGGMSGITATCSAWVPYIPGDSCDSTTKGWWQTANDSAATAWGHYYTTCAYIFSCNDIVTLTQNKNGTYSGTGGNL